MKSMWWPARLTDWLESFMAALFWLGDHSICSMATFAPLYLNSAGLITPTLSPDTLAPTPMPKDAGSKDASYSAPLASDSGVAVGASV